MSFFQPDSSSCNIASKNQLVILLVRGIAGIGFLSYAFSSLPRSPFAGWGLMAVAVFLLKGCPACWGMHVINALRNIKKPQSSPVSGQLERQRTPRTQYEPKDMADQLFPPEDVHRFRQNNQQA